MTGARPPRHGSGGAECSSWQNGDQGLSGVAAGAGAARGEPDGHRRRAGRHRRPVRVGQDHAAAPDGHPGPADHRHGPGHRPRRGRARRPGAGRAAGDPDRVRVPAVLPGRAPDRAGQRGRRPAVRRRPPRPSGGRLAAAALDRVGLAHSCRSPADPAVGRGAAAGRDRPGAGRPRRPSCWPTSRPATSTGHRRGHPGPAGGAQRGRGHHRRHHPRPGGRGPDARAGSRCSTGTSSPTPARRRAVRRAGVAMHQPAPQPSAPPGPAAARPTWPRLASVGLRTRKLRAALSALGIAIGVAAIVAVLGLSASSPGRAARRDRPARHQPAHRHQRADLFGHTAELPVAGPGDDRPDARRHRGPGHRRRHQRQRLPQPADPRRQHQRAHRPGRQPRPARSRRDHRRPGQLPQRRHRRASRSPCSAPPPRSGSASTGSSPGERIWVGGQWFYVAGHPQPGRARPGHRHLASWSASRPRRSTSASTGTRRPSTSARRPPRSTAGAHPARPRRPTRRTPTRSTSASRRPRWSPRPTRKGALNGLFLGLGAVALLVGAIGVANIMVISVLERRSRDRAAPRARRHPRATSAPSSSPRPSCSPWSAAPPGSRPARPPPPSTPTPRAGRSSSRPRPGRAAWPPPCSSAPSPGCCPRSAPPACHPPKPC